MRLYQVVILLLSTAVSSRPTEPSMAPFTPLERESYEFLYDHGNKRPKVKACGTHIPAGDLHIPGLDEWERGARVACKKLFPEPSDTYYGFHRTIVNLWVYDSPVKVPYSYELWTPARNGPACRRGDLLCGFHA
ncbi:hypothetical protein M011DRAFT_145577 [Sporormia fimetaria CBS 119925]|uniref:Uncharacterized protein n=1 Tax=Sporormia fimetaria CBS 119925 TaxID=1340428 RepID=A0A6A6V874_9PLEO|nr:hypothetical protein M011DRAFT_145577 [Sporormia fimetaria CBS 119925]